MDKVIAINLFGACSVKSIEAGAFELTGAKHKALFALLATAPFGTRTRSFLHEILWGTSCFDTGRQSLRRALSDIKQIMGPAYGEVLAIRNSEITLDLSRVFYVGRPQQGIFLEGLEIKERQFTEWVTGIRENSGQLDCLFSLGRQPSFIPVVPMVAVIPFRTLTVDPQQKIFGDWLAEETCRSLSRSRFLGVISHLSCREMAREQIDLAKIKNILAANYCLYGSIRIAQSEVVVDVEFIDVQSSRIIWTRQYNASLQNFFENAHQSVDMIVHAVGQSIADESMRYVGGRELADIELHRLLAAGIGLMHQPRIVDFAKARTYLEEVARRAPTAPEPRGWLGKWYILNVFKGWSADSRLDTQRALDETARGLDFSPTDAFCLTIDGYAQNNLLRRLDVAESRYAAALRYNPNESIAWLLKGVLLAFQDRGEEGIHATSHARRLSPVDPFGYFYDSLSATAHFSGGDYVQALSFAERSLSVNSQHISTRRTQVASLYYLGRHEESRAAAEELMRRSPEFTVDAYLKNHPAGQFSGGRRIAEALKASGVA